MPRVIHCEGLCLWNARHELRAMLYCGGGDGMEPAFTMYDAQGNPRIDIRLTRTSAVAGNGEGCYTVEKPVIVLRDHGREIRITLYGDARIEVGDECGTTQIDTVILATGIERALQ